MSTWAGPGISRSPDSHRRMVRPLETPKTIAHFSAERPSLCRASLNL